MFGPMLWRLANNSAKNKLRCGAGSLLLSMMVLIGCSDRKETRVVEDGGVGRRVFRPPPKSPVRALPPHNIHAKGVGPYELGADLHTILALLPTGLGVELFGIEGLFDYHLVRAENNALTIGVMRRGGVQFVSVLDPDIARTESGVGVGAKVEDLVVALGAIQPALGGERDERLVVFSALPNTRFVVEGDRVIAAVVVREKISDPATSPPESVAECDQRQLRDQLDQVLATARLGKDAKVSIGCDREGQKAIAAVWKDQRVHVVAVDGGKLRRLNPQRILGLEFVGMVKAGNGWGMHAVSQLGRPEAREVNITSIRVEGGRTQLETPRTALRLSASSAGYVGAKLSNTEFLVELEGGERSLEVSALFVQKRMGKLRNVVPVLTASLPIAGKTAPNQGSLSDRKGRADAGPKGPKNKARSADSGSP